MKSLHSTKHWLKLILLLSLLTCEPKERILPESSGSLLLGIELSDNEISNGRISADTKLSVVISIKKESGEIILDQEVLKLTKVKKEYVTKPISLVAGNYEVTDFLIVDENDEAIYITPQTGSLLSYLVETAVPIPFSIETDNTTKLTPEVISTEKKSPKDFGYSSFAFDYQETFDFLIAVFTYDYEKDEYELADAALKVKADGNLVFDSILYAGTIQITLPANHTDYEVIVNKATWKTYLQNFTKEELILHFDEADLGPLHVYLDKGLILWNKLGSYEETNSSMIGPDGAVLGTVTFEDCQFDGGSFYNQNGESTGFDLTTIENNDFRAGAIEYWIKPAFNLIDGVPQNFTGQGLTFMTSETGLILSLVFHPKYKTYGAISYQGESSYTQIIAIDNSTDWSANDLVHIAMTWDISDTNSGKSISLYINGEETAFTSDGIDVPISASVFSDLFVGNNNYLDRPVNCVVDNFKFFDYPKGDFSDRFLE